MSKSRKSKPATRRPGNPVEARLDHLEAQVAALKEQLAELGATPEELAEIRDDVDGLRAAVEARGAVPNPTADLSPSARATRARNAAKARGAKDVGRGSGRVLTKATQAKLKKEADAASSSPKRKRRR